VFAFEILNEVGDEMVVEIFTSEVSGLDLENTFFNRQKGDIESSTSKIENKNVALAGDLLVEAIDNSSSGRFIDNSEHETCNGSIFSGLALGVVVLSGNGDDNVGDGASKDKPWRSPSFSGGTLKKFLQGRISTKQGHL
jgi:hypothetical protein